MTKTVPATMEERIKKLNKNDLFKLVGEAVFNQANEHERRDLQLKVLQALVLELDKSNRSYNQLQNDHFKLIDSYDDLQKKFDKLKAKSK